MTCEFFGTFHIISLISVPILIILLYLLLRKTNRLVKTIVLLIISLVGIWLLMDELIRTKNIFSHLPFHMCSMNGFLLPFVILTKNKRIGNMLALWCFGALGALIFNFEINALTTADIRTWTYTIPHMIQFCVPILLILLKHIELDYKLIPSTVILTIFFYTLAHFVNVGLIEYYAKLGQSCWANYMFSIGPGDNIFLLFFWKICPHQYWYMYCIIPLVIILLCILYLKQIIKTILEKKRIKNINNN